MRTSLLALLLALLVLPLLTLAQTQAKYTPLVNIPGITDAGGDSFSKYVNFLYALSISIAALIAVIKIIIAGVKYMVTDVVPAKGEALKDIKGALLGLLVILGAIVILNTINPQLLRGGLTFNEIPPNPPSMDRSSIQATGALAAPGMNSCVRQSVVQGAIVYNTASCDSSVSAFTERDKFKSWCENDMRGKFMFVGTGGVCAPAVNIFDGSGNTQTQNPAGPAGAGGESTAGDNTTCTAKRTDTTTQGNFTVYTYDLTNCSGQGLSSRVSSYRDACDAAKGNFTGFQNVYECRVPKN